MNIFKRARFWFSFFMLCIAAAFVIMAIPYDADAKLFPLIIGIPTALAGIVIVASEKWPKLLSPFDVNVGLSVKVIEKSIDEEEKVEGPQKVEITDRQKVGRIFTAVAWMAGYIIVVMLVGFNPANFLLPTLYIKVHARSSWWKAPRARGRPRRSR